MADKTIANPQGAFGVSDLEQNGWCNAPSFKAGGVITAKNVVVFSTDGLSVTAATTGSTASLQAGVALDSGVTNDTIRVAVHGVVKGCVAEGTISASGILKRSGTTAAALAATASPAAGEAIAVALAASSGGLVDVWVCKSV